MEKTLVFDMDGTIVDLYGVENWLDMIRSENTLPYEIAEPMYNMNDLNIFLAILKTFGWHIVVTSWLSMGGSKSYNRKVTNAKINWLNEYNFPYDEIHIVKYGTTKANCTKSLGGYQILIDDNEKIRNGWSLGSTINANENILDKLEELVLTELAR